MVQPYLVETLCCAAQFFKYDARAKRFVVTDAPEIVAESYLARRGRWLLGRSKNIETPVNATIFATGNNLTVVGDLTRRTVMCALDAHCEHPERRNFNVDVIELARAERAKLVAAALTLLCAWYLAGETIEPPPFGGFEEWSYRIRAPLLWLGQADPCETTLKVQTEDPLLLSLATVMAQWRQHVGMRAERTVQQVINCAINVNDFHVALLNVAQGRSGGMVSNERLGRWLRKNEGRVVGGLMLNCTGRLDGYPTWSLVPV
jgi:putative DNA primase/helicase